jgi:hypothetical protein
MPVDERLLPPLPDDITTCHKELRYWQQQVIVARSSVAKLKVDRECMKRSQKGDLEKLNEMKDFLKSEMNRAYDIIDSHNQKVARCIEELKAIANVGDDPSSDHGRADSALMDCIDNQEVTKLFNSIEKLYE